MHHQSCHNQIAMETCIGTLTGKLDKAEKIIDVNSGFPGVKRIFGIPEGMDNNLEIQGLLGETMEEKKCRYTEVEDLVIFNGLSWINALTSSCDDGPAQQVDKLWNLVGYRTMHSDGKQTLSVLTQPSYDAIVHRGQVAGMTCRYRPMINRIGFFVLCSEVHRKK